MDILENKPLEIRIGQHGLVKIIDCMPRLVNPGETFDHAICQAARTSYGSNDVKPSEKVNRGLIRYLFRHEHGTPFEMVNIKFYLSLPIFIARQIIRTRTASVNEYSMRYKQPKDKFFVPEVNGVRLQSTDNKQGSQEKASFEDASAFILYTEQVASEALKKNEEFEQKGIGREINRINMPLSTFTEWYWEIDFRNLLHFLSLRLDSHTQKETREYAEAMYSLCKPLAPYSFEAFEDFEIGSIRLSKLEIEAIKSRISLLSAKSTERERVEFAEKLKRLGL